MINRTFNRCCQSLSKENIFVATDDLRIYSHCQELNMNVIMTPSSCKTGTDRVYEASKKINSRPAGLIQTPVKIIGEVVE